MSTGEEVGWRICTGIKQLMCAMGLGSGTLEMCCEDSWVGGKGGFCIAYSKIVACYTIWTTMEGGRGMA